MSLLGVPMRLPLWLPATGKKEPRRRICDCSAVCIFCSVRSDLPIRRSLIHPAASRSVPLVIYRSICITDVLRTPSNRQRYVAPFQTRSRTVSCFPEATLARHPPLSAAGLVRSLARSPRFASVPRESYSALCTNHSSPIFTGGFPASTRPQCTMESSSGSVAPTMRYGMLDVTTTGDSFVPLGCDAS